MKEFINPNLRVHPSRIELLERQVNEVIENLKGKADIEEALENLHYMLEGLGGILSIPMNTIFCRFPRDIRILAKDLNKEVAFSYSGGWVELPKEMEEDVTHFVRHLISWIMYSLIQQQGSFSIESNVEESNMVLTIDVESEDPIPFNIKTENQLDFTYLRAGRSSSLDYYEEQLSATHTYTQSEKELSLTIAIPMTRVIK